MPHFFEIARKNINKPISANMLMLILINNI